MNIKELVDRACERDRKAFEEYKAALFKLHRRLGGKLFGLNELEIINAVYHEINKTATL